MNPEQSPIKITARWDHGQAPIGEAVVRGLLIDIEAAAVDTAPQSHRPPVNLALVIDRSGSMQGAPIHAAIEAAVGVTRQLREGDRLSVVAYDDHIDVLVDGQAMDAAGKQRTEQAIRSLHARGSTDLAGGWLRGARCVAEVMDRHGFESGHVVLLSDGQANQGETDPGKLAELAGELAGRNVTSTCVGIGEHYSLLQMAAIAEHGQGEMHQSSEPEEIIEVLSGEIGEQTQIVARNFTLQLEGLGVRGARQLTRYREHARRDRQEYFLGSLVGGQKRRVALLFEFEAQPAAADQHYTLTGSWLDPQTGNEQLRAKEHFTMHFVPPAQFKEGERDKLVAEEIAQLWMARQGYDAMLHNERGDYAAAARSLDENRPVFARMIVDLDAGVEMLSTHDRLRERTQERWDGLSKKEYLSFAHKRMRSKFDHRSGREGQDWADLDRDQQPKP